MVVSVVAAKIFTALAAIAASVRARGCIRNKGLISRSGKNAKTSHFAHQLFYGGSL